jgi:AraC-like DNA-binding protein
MHAVRFIFARDGGKMLFQGRAHIVPRNSVVVTHREASLCETGGAHESRNIDFYAADFKKLFPDVVDLLDNTRQAPFWFEPVHIVKAETEVFCVIELLVKAMPDALFRFFYVYCLGVERRYFSALLHHMVSDDTALVQFVESHFLRQWSVERFAEEFGMPQRKFNALFRAKYGTSAKRWLLERRLNHARKLLLSTTMRVLDIALDCGFSNHAHFTDSFRNRYRCNPTQFRSHTKGQPLTATN